MYYLEYKNLFIKSLIIGIVFLFVSTILLFINNLLKENITKNNNNYIQMYNKKDDISRNTFLDDLTCNVAVIPVQGTIVGYKDINASSSEMMADASIIIQKIKDANDAENIKAIILEISSPGGMPAATERITNELKLTNKPKVAQISDIAYSAGYWIASAADYIFAQKTSEVGSIGVTQSYLENVNKDQKYIDLSTGPYKTLLDPNRKITEKEIQFIKNKLELSEDIFVNEVAINRNKTFDEIKKIATGEWWNGIEAKKLGLIDEIGYVKEVEDYVFNIINKDNFTGTQNEFYPCY